MAFGILWRTSGSQAPATTALDGDLSVDLAIIGGGFTGCSAALEAARTGARVAVLEAQQIGHGGSGRNVGLVNAGLWLPPDDVLSILGDVAGHRLLTALSEGPAKVWSLIDREGIDCEATRNGTLHLAHARSGLADLNNRLQQGVRLGAPILLLDDAETARRTGTAQFCGALWDPRAGTIQPLSYCRGLARAAIAAGATICENAQVTAIRHERGQWVLQANGHQIRAGALLMATNAYHETVPGSFRPRFVAVNYSQFATAPLPAEARNRILPGGEGCWDTALVMTSFRMDQLGRLILGSMGNAQGRGGRVHIAWARRRLRNLFPDLGDLPFEHIWHGRIAMTGDHVPKVVSFGPRALSIFGYSGRGISPGTVFGTAAAGALLEDRPDLLPLPVIQVHDERLVGLRQNYYEFGATLAHAIGPASLG